VAGFDGHQGIALVVEPRTWAGIDDVLARAVERGEPPFVLVLDSLEDPQNVGTLLRSAEAAGVHGVLFPTRRQAPLTPAAIKASAGAVEHLLLCPVEDLPGALSDLRIRGLRVAAAEADAPLTAAQADLRGPLAIVVGSEGQGLSPIVRRRADISVRIPMRGAIGSLNAAVAGSILLFAAVAQRDPDGEDSMDRPRPATFDDIAAASSAPDVSSNEDEPIGALPPGAEEPVTDLAEAPEGIAGAAEPDGSSEPATGDAAESVAASSSPTAPKRRRKVAPTEAAPASPAAPAPPGAPISSAALARKRARPPAPTTAAQKRSRARTADPAAATKPPAIATKPLADAKAAPRKRVKAARPSDADPVVVDDPAGHDLLPGGPKGE